MSAYTIKNLKHDVEDSAQRFGLSPDLEAHFARGALESSTIGLSYQRLAPNFRVPFGHRHVDEEEVYVVLRGGGRMALGDEVVAVRPMDAIRVAPDLQRGFEAGPDGAELLVFGAGYEARDGQVSGDAEMQPGWWPEA